MSCSYFHTCDKDITRDQSEAAEAAEEVSYNNICRNFVKEAQAEGIYPEDIRAVLQILQTTYREKK
jgi:hypothetical protein